MTLPGELVTIPAREIVAGDELRLGWDVFWEVVRVEPSQRHPGDILVTLAHGHKYTYDPQEGVEVRR
jgi:hypothetical protein